MSKLEPYIKDAQSWARGDVLSIGHEECRKLANFDGPVTHCGLRPLGNGHAGLLAIAEACHTHSCRTHRWVFTLKHSEPIRLLPAELEFYLLYSGVEVGPDQDYVLIDSGLSDAPGTGPLPSRRHHAGVIQRNLTNGNRTRRQECFSHVLSPGGKWFVCRDERANVLRIPVNGKETQVIVRANIPTLDIMVGGSTSYYPTQVRFLNASQMQFSVVVHEGSELFYDGDQGLFLSEATWSEEGPMSAVDASYKAPTAPKR